MSGVEHVRAYGLPEVAVGRDGVDASPVVPLLLVVIALAAATSLASSALGRGVAQAAATLRFAHQCDYDY